MAFLPTSAINGSALPAEMVRLANSTMAPGRSGIYAPGDLLVRGLGAGGVSIGPGAAILANRFTLANGRQSYLVSNDAANDDAVLAVPAAGSGAPRTDYVGIRVDDVQYAGTATPKGCHAVLVSSLSGIAYPFVVLAKIVQPAGNSAGVQQSMITDLRVMARPQVDFVKRARPTITGDVGLALTATGVDGEVFPNAGGVQTIDIPDFAVRAQIEAKWMSVAYDGGDINAYFWVEFGPWVRTSVLSKATQLYAANSVSQPYRVRDAWICSDDVYIPAAYRGTSQLFYLKGRKISGPGSIKMDAAGGVTLDVKFLEQADPSTS